MIESTTSFVRVLYFIMKSKELRVGNYVVVNRKTDVLQTVGEWCYTAFTAEENPLDQMKPIELNDDLILMLGFNETEDDTYAIGLPLGMGIDLVLEKRLINGYDTLIQQEPNTFIYLKEVYFVHELQNLFYGLCGEDIALGE